MDDPNSSVVSIPSNSSLDDIQRAMQSLTEAMTTLAEAVEVTADSVYTTSRGGKHFTIDATELEDEAADDEAFKQRSRRQTRD
jgi:hypothetical protein